MAAGTFTRLLHRRPSRPDPDLVARFDGAMHVARQLAAELEVARARHRPADVRRGLHDRIDHELENAATVATTLYDELVSSEGGTRRAQQHPEVQLWKRRLNTALTLRSQHQLAEFDDVGVIVPADAKVRTRAAYGPHQAGMDFDTDPEGVQSPQAGSTASPARATTGVDLDTAVETAPRGR